MLVLAELKCDGSRRVVPPRPATTTTRTTTTRNTESRTTHPSNTPREKIRRSATPSLRYTQTSRYTALYLYICTDMVAERERERKQFPSWLTCQCSLIRNISVEELMGCIRCFHYEFIAVLQQTRSTSSRAIRLQQVAWAQIDV